MSFIVSLSLWTPKPTLPLCYNCSVISDTSLTVFQDVCAAPRMYHALVKQADLEQHTPKGKYTERKGDVARSRAMSLMGACAKRARNKADHYGLVHCFHSPLSARKGAELLECPMKNEFHVQVEQCCLSGW